MSDMRVTPDELRTAASAIDALADGLVHHPGFVTGLQDPVPGLAGIATGHAMTEAVRAVASALEVLHDRVGEWKTVLDHAADDYIDTDATAAARLAGMGELNASPRNSGR
ncbi:WXG100 family type VII secretion target [Williamsia sterculiae]|uniref:Uncharacterized conserved protein YukE n=1 Tax=Williamsia sterculiae TaxID=1344003 RepID=A0A1N7FVH9_9NOCA|nr:type VII secretion target [Williamsia sterculiae]SIS04256.1 Uncharacterized conserved protein YukE [Williamsia sterculiae]